MLLFLGFFVTLKRTEIRATKMRSIFSKWLKPATRVDLFCRSHEGIRDFHSHRFSRVKSPSKICLFCVCVFFPCFKSKFKKHSRKITYTFQSQIVCLFVCLFVCLLILFLLFKWPLGLRTWTPTKDVKTVGDDVDHQENASHLLRLTQPVANL